MCSSTTGAPKRAGGIHDLGLRLDEERDTDAGLREVLDRLAQTGRPCATDIEAALGGPLLALLGHEAGGVRAQPSGQADHLRGRRHLEVERHEDLAPQPLDVLVADVATILAKMRRDAVGAGQHREMGGPDRIRVGTAAGVPQGRDMVDVDAEAQQGNCHESVLAQAMPLSSHPRAVRNFLMRRVAVSTGGSHVEMIVRIRRSGPMRPTKRHNFRGCAVWGTTVVPLRGKTSLTRHHIVNPPAMQLRMPHGR